MSDVLNDAGTYGIEAKVVATTHGAIGEIDGVETMDHVACVAARNDYLPTDEWVGDATYDEIMSGTSTKRLIGYLLKPPGHFGPFEHPSLTIAIKGVSRVTMAQITRHRVGISFDVQSSRYTTPSFDLIREVSAGAKPLTALEDYVVVPKLDREMGRSDVFLADVLDAFVAYADAYDEAISRGYPESRAKEDARYRLPDALRVNMVISANLRTWMHIADMRAAGDAQWEVRAMTNEVLDAVADHAPVTIDTYNDLLHGRKNRLAP